MIEYQNRSIKGFSASTKNSQWLGLFIIIIISRVLIWLVIKQKRRTWWRWGNDFFFSRVNGRILLAALRAAMNTIMRNTGKYKRIRRKSSSSLSSFLCKKTDANHTDVAIICILLEKVDKTFLRNTRHWKRLDSKWLIIVTLNYWPILRHLNTQSQPGKLLHNGF